MSVSSKRRCIEDALLSKEAHIILLAVGTSFLLAGAFHGNVWFDESYSVGIASHSFADIWRIGSADVHPVLFYWALHVLYLIFGSNILVYRLFAVAGSVALAALGFTHLRKDFGATIGLLFTFFALFMPYVANMSIEIRMYSWATFCVAACGIYALRIAHHCGQQVARVPMRAWVIFAVTSLASAYLHYFGTLSAFMINLLLLLFLLCRANSHRREVVIFVALAVCQVLLYAPWLAQLAGQIGVVSQTYWANIVFPDTYIELLTYPVRTSQVAFALKGWYGQAVQIAAIICVVSVLISLAIAICALVLRARRGLSFDRQMGLCKAQGAHGGLAENQAAHDWWACLAALAVYVGVFAIAWVASIAMDSLIVYYRYMFVAIGPLIFVLSVVLAHVGERWARLFVVAAFAAVAVLNQGLAISDDYSSENTAPLAYFQNALTWASADSLDGASESPNEDGEGQPLVLSADIGIQGVAAVTFPDIRQTYLDWQQGNWAAAYEAYAPTLSSVKSWEEALDGKTGRFVVLGQSADGSTPSDIRDIDNMEGVSCADLHVFYRPYERTYFVVACMVKK